MAVNVTLVPEQIVVPGLADMPTLTALFALTVIVIVLLVAGLPIGQLTFEVNTQVTISPLANPALV